jgi:hypothetical protein
MTGPDRENLERLRYRQGQMLRSRDFRDQLAIEAQLRGWHNRAMHNAFGVADGFEVTLDQQHRSVTICPGVAYDCFGRELIQTHQRQLPLPDTGGIMTLLARYKDSSAFPAREAVTGACSPGAGCLFQEAVEFVWKPADTLAVRDGVPLQQVDVGATPPTLTPGFVVPRARALARPHIRSGATLPGATAWEIWDLPLGPASNPHAFKVRIDTSAAGFTETPCYFAWLQGSLASLSGPEPVLTPYLSQITEASSGGFTFCLILATLTIQTGRIVEIRQDLRAFLHERQAFASWLGIQPNARPGGYRAACFK